MDTEILIRNTSHPEHAKELLKIILGKNIKSSLPIDLLINLLGSSYFAYREIKRTPNILNEIAPLFGKENEDFFYDLSTEIFSMEEEKFLKALRKWRNKHYLEIIASDISGYIPVKITTRYLSYIAKIALEVSYKYYFSKVTGIPEEFLNNSGFFIIGMGKLGGMELNFSSDIDIIFMYEKNKEIEEILSRQGLYVKEVFTKLARNIKKALNTRTEDGFVFRVDLRLRPAGEKGPLVPSTEFSLNYYEQYGETWERSAYLRASVIAGDIKAGKQFLKNLEPFIYRRTLDYTTIEDLRILKRKIDKEAKWRSGNGWNVKLGEGGIREVEFMVQTLQLIFGGKKPTIRGQNTFDILPRLYNEELISREDFYALYIGYSFLRRVENALQMEFDTQTQLLEFSDEKILNIAKKLGYRETEAKTRFLSDLERHRGNIFEIFRTFFKEAEVEGKDPYYPITSREISEEELEEFIRNELKFLPLERARQLVNLLRTGGKKWVPPGSIKYLHKIVSLLIEELKKSPDPEEASINLEKFLGKVIYQRNFMALLSENSGVVRFLIKLFGVSNYLSNFFISHPELLDTLVLSSYARLTKEKKEYEQEIEEIISISEDTEEILNELRRYKNSEILRIGIHDIGGKIGILSVTEQLSDLAEALLEATIKVVEKDLSRKYGKPTGKSATTSRLLTIAMGKLGGREINYHSDLDLIFVYTENGETTGPKKITNIEFYTKLVQKLITYLTVPTREGKLYDIDMRLRPSGKAGPLVTSLNSFKEYHSKEAATWEKLALTKARVIEQLEEAEILKEIIKNATTGEYLTQEDIKEIVRIRKRMEKELSSGEYDLKYAPGGIVDIEFIVQFLILKYGKEKPSIVSQNTWYALNQIKKEHLLPTIEASLLQKGYIFFRFIENRLRLTKDYPLDTLPTDRKALKKLAIRMRIPGSAPEDKLLYWFRYYKNEIRKIFDKYLNSDEIR